MLPCGKMKWINYKPLNKNLMILTLIGRSDLIEVIHGYIIFYCYRVLRL